MAGALDFGQLAQTLGKPTGGGLLLLGGESAALLTQAASQCATILVAALRQSCR
jgi:hypothetical protein